MTMMFAVLLSAFVVRKSSRWLTDFAYNGFCYSTIDYNWFEYLISFGKKTHSKKTIKKRHYYISFTALQRGILFVILQFMGFGQMMQDRLLFLGSEVQITNYTFFML
jgi:cytochrome c oxidase subunit 3